MTHLIIADRDGTLIEDGHYISKIDQVHLIPRIDQAISLLKSFDVDLCVASNQSGIARGLFDANSVHDINAFVKSNLDPAGEIVKHFFFCPHLPSDGCTCRKPQVGMYDLILQAIAYVPETVHVVGDRACDIYFGLNISAFNYHVLTGKGQAERALVADLPQTELCVDFLDAVHRIIAKLT